MRRYLSTLHKRSDAHKKNFALLASGGFTLAIFTVWLFVNYGDSGTVVVDNNAAALRRNAPAKEVGPLESVGNSLGAAWEGLTESFGGLSGSVNFESGYDEMKDKTLDTYGR